MLKLILLSFLLCCRLAAGADPATNAPPIQSATGDLSQYKTADALWTHINDQVQTLTTGLHSQDPAVKTLIPQIRADAEALVRQYPQDAHVWDAKMLVAQLGGLAARLQIAGAPTPQQITQQLEDIAGDKTAPQTPRAEASAFLISQAIQLAGASPADASAPWEAVETRIADFQKQFGNNFSFGGGHPAIAMFRAQELDMLKSSNNTTRFQALLQKLATDPQADVAGMAQQALAAQKQMADLKSKPMDLKFTAVDGTEIDLAKLRGKVVLVDFWATWCPPCREEVPNVVAAYKKFHDRGFEVIGVSLDQDKDKLLAFTKENGMTWPQYFDGKGWDNTVSKSFGIDSIPAMWLVDKKGMVMTTDGSGDLAGQVEKALQVP